LVFSGFSVGNKLIGDGHLAVRLKPIMLLKLPTMLLSTAPKSSQLAMYTQNYLLFDK